MRSREEQAEFFDAAEKVQQTVLNHLNTNRSRTFAITFISNLQRGVDNVVQAAIDNGQKFDCKAGCSYCCSARVEALEPEIFQIASELKKLPPDNIAEITARLRKHAAIAKGLAVSDYHLSCPFLKENLCSIYSIRPAVCRKAHSYDVEKCRATASEIPESLEIALKSEALMKGTAEAYSQASLPASGHELGQAVLLALTDETAESRWYSGEHVFNAAE
jgi:Fe-S-cluster containining protein